jgi:hypothetical protein
MRFTKASRNFPLAYVMVLLTLYDQTVGHDPLLADFFVHGTWAEQENIYVKYALNQNNYNDIIKFGDVNNGRTGPMRPGTFISGNFYPDDNAASQALHKRVTFAMVFFQNTDTKSFYLVNMLLLDPLPDLDVWPPLSENQSEVKPKPQSTFQNKRD